MHGLLGAGAPMSVLHHLGLGVWSFLASPALGIVESTQGGGLNLPRLLGGFVQGCHSLTNSILLAITTSTAKAASATRRALASLGLDRLEATGILGSVHLPSTLSCQHQMLFAYCRARIISLVLGFGYHNKPLCTHMKTCDPALGVFKCDSTIIQYQADMWLSKTLTIACILWLYPKLDI